MELRRNGKTVLLVTHAVHFLPQVDYIYSIESGSIVKQGTYSDLSSSFNFSDSSSEEEEIEAVETVVNATASNGKVGPGCANPTNGQGRLTVAEERITGAVGPRVYAAYIRAGGIMWLAPLILTTICMQASQLMSRYASTVAQLTAVSGSSTGKVTASIACRHSTRASTHFLG